MQSGTGYRYGFNGQEKSDEVNEDGNSYTAEFWQYDARIGRRWNLDPKPTVGISQYSAFSNNPISFIDIKGDTTGDPCGTCGVKETSGQKAVRIAAVNFARILNGDYSLALSKEVTDDKITAVQLGYQWVMGTGDNERNFNEESVMGKQMLKAQEVEEGINRAIYQFGRYGKATAVFARRASTENELLYVKSFFEDLDKNPARAFHGSYRGNVTVTKTEQTTFGVNYYLNVTITDNMTAGSGFRLPPFLGGYSKGAALIKGENPYGPDGYFRNIKVNYDMNIKVFRFNSVEKNVIKFFYYMFD